MNRKHGIIFITVMLFVCFCMLTACQHTCSFGEWQTVKEPTCVAEGLQERYCTDPDCDKKEQKTIEIDPTKHNLTPVELDDATCTEDGTVAHKHCTLCGKNFDENGQELNNVTIAKRHKFNTVEAVEESDHTDGMQAYRTCEVCEKNYALTEEVEVDLADLVVSAKHNNYDKDTLYCETCDKYVITNAEQFALFRDTVNSSEKYKSKTVVLDADIDLNNEEWQPINGFLGTFDGQGHTISNLKITGQNKIGLFGDMWQCNATVCNFVVDGAVITGEENVGVIVGVTASTQIKNVTVKDAVINANHWAGGIVGYAYAEISGCSVDGLKIVCVPNVVGEGYDNGDKVGGIVGYLAANSVTGCNVQNAVLQGYRDIGGIAGTLQSSDGVVASATNNSVSSITIKVDQVTNHYGAKEMNANAVVGRVLNGTGLITVVQDNETERISYEYTVNAASAQIALDTFEDNSTVKLVADDYGKLYIRQSKYVSVNTSTSSYPWYLREITNVNIVGESGVVISGLEIVAGHQYSGNNSIYDPVTGQNHDYYSNIVIKNLDLSNLKFIEKCEFNGWYNNLLSCDGLSIVKCEFDMEASEKASQSSGTTAAIRFGSGEDARIWKNLVFEQCVFKNAFQGIFTTNVEGLSVKQCKFENIKHNAIAIQNTEANGKAGTVGGTIVIDNNEFTNGADRAIRFGNVGADAAITVKNNTFTEFCDDNGDILKTVNTSVGATIVFENNSYNGTVLGKQTIQCNGDVVVITNK